MEVKRIADSVMMEELSLPSYFSTEMRKYGHHLAESHGLQHITKRDSLTRLNVLYLRKKIPKPEKPAREAGTLPAEDSLTSNEGSDVISQNSFSLYEFCDTLDLFPTRPLTNDVDWQISLLYWDIVNRLTLLNLKKLLPQV